jgi:hypothetical protein
MKRFQILDCRPDSHREQIGAAKIGKETLVWDAEVLVTSCSNPHHRLLRRNPFIVQYFCSTFLLMLCNSDNQIGAVSSSLTKSTNFQFSTLNAQF